MPLAPSLLGRKCWSYAKNSPQDSVGEYRGILYPAKLGGGIHCWAAKGDALLLFKDSIKPKILDFLSKNTEKIHDSSDYLCIPMYMVWKRQEKSKPVVFFVSDDEAARKEAFEMVKGSKILDAYPGIELGHTDMGKMMALAGKGDTVLGRCSLYQDGTSVLRLVPESVDGQNAGISAVGGGVLECQGRYYILTANHFLDERQHRPTAPASGDEKGKAIETSNCEITGLSDFDDDSDEDEDETTFSAVESTSQGSMSESDDCHSESEQDSESSNFTMTPLKLEDSHHSEPGISRREIQRRESRVNEPSQLSPGGDILSVGTIVSCSQELDYALIEVSESSWDRLPIRMLPESLSCSNKHAFVTKPRAGRVWAVTPSKGRIEGLISGDFQDIRFPHCQKFTRVSMATFKESVSPGDCGSWVRDAVTGQLYGHLVAGTVGHGQAFIVPTNSVLEHAGLTNQIFLTEADILTMAVAEFGQYVEREHAVGLGASGSRPFYLPLPVLKEYWQKPHARKALESLAKMHGQEAQILLRSYILILSILLHIGCPELLGQFIDRGDNDNNLPYIHKTRVPLDNITNPEGQTGSQADRFFEDQWLFLPINFSEETMFESELESMHILPVEVIKQVEVTFSPTGDVVSELVEVGFGGGDFVAPELPTAKRVVFRRYPAEKSRLAYAEILSVQQAVADFAPSTEQIQFQFYGSFFQERALTTILLYPAAGLLAGLIDSDERPVSSEELIRLWASLGEPITGLDNFFIAREKGLDYGTYHLEITPAKILLFPEPSNVLFGFKPKLDVLGLATTNRKLQPTDEIWGLGSAFSEVLVWTTMGSRGVKSYKQQRKKESPNHEFLFRHESSRLDCVDRFHKLAKVSRPRWDELTPKISDFVLHRMLGSGKCPIKPLLADLVDILSQEVELQDLGGRKIGLDALNPSAQNLTDPKYHHISNHNKTSGSSHRPGTQPPAYLVPKDQKEFVPLPPSTSTEYGFDFDEDLMWDDHEYHPPPPSTSTDRGPVLPRVDPLAKGKGTKGNFQLPGSEFKENMKKLEGVQHIFVIDDYESISSHAEEVKSVIKSMADMIRSSKSAEVALCFTSQLPTILPSDLRPDDPTFIDEIIAVVGARLLQQRKGSCVLDSVLRRIREYLDRQQGDKNPIHVYFITTGLMSRVPRSSISKIITGRKRIDNETIYHISASFLEFGRYDRALSIRFIRFGEDPAGIANLGKIENWAEESKIPIKVGTSRDDVWDILTWGRA